MTYQNNSIKFVPSTVIIGPRGPCVTRGYVEICGVRFYQDQVVVGPRGEHQVSEGWAEIAGDDDVKL